MAIQNENGMGPADFAAMMGNAGGMGGFGSGGAVWWMMILFLFAFMGNWGGGYGNGGGSTPYVVNTVGSDVQRGFDQQSVMAAIGNVGNNVVNGFAGADVARCNQTTTILQTLANNNMANQQTLNSLAMSLQQCCCDNRAATADLKYTIATENCADRQAVNDGVRDIQAQNAVNTNLILNAVNEKYQGIQDKLCQLELDGIRQNYEGQLRDMQRQLDSAQNEIAATRSNASQTAQTAELMNYIRNLVGNCGFNTGCNTCSAC